MNRLKHLAAAAFLALTLTTYAYAAPAIVIYQEAANTTLRDAFAWGSTAFDTVTGASHRKCYRVQFFDPSNNVVATHDLPGPNTNGTGPRTDSFVVPSGPSGTWTATEAEWSATDASCTGTLGSVTSTTTFDVARAVVIGAGTTGSDSVGGDNDVNEAQLTVVQGSGTAATGIVAPAAGSRHRIFLQFTILSISGSVTNAEFRLLEKNSPNSTRTHDVNRVTQTWGEISVTWMNQPTVFGTLTGSATVPAATLEHIYFPVTSDVAAFVGGSFANQGWRISD